MTIEADDVRAIARLARLQIADSDLPGYTNQLSAILDFVHQMNAIDTEGVEPLAHPLELAARLRPDTVTVTIDRERLQSCAPSTNDGFYLVPRVIE